MLDLCKLLAHRLLIALKVVQPLFVKLLFVRRS
jgi:hypothetical protein